MLQCCYSAGAEIAQNPQVRKVRMCYSVFMVRALSQIMPGSRELH